MNHVVDDLVEDALRELADESAQRDLWLAVDGPRVSSFTECISRLWDDSGLGDALDGVGEVYVAAIDERLRVLRSLLRRIDDRRPPDRILEDPRLDEARAMARHVLTDLRRHGADAE